jgi:hypothetical protein
MQVDFMKFMSKAATDDSEREIFLADPRAYLLTNGLDLPDFVEVTAVEISGSNITLAFGIPLMLNMEELSDDALSGVYGGKTNVNRPGTGDN